MLHGVLKLFTHSKSTLAASCMLLASAALQAAENIDTANYNDTEIVDQLWQNSAFPFTWFMNENGVVNNDALGLGTPAVSDSDAETELAAAFQIWQNVPTASISANYGGLTATADIACDLENIVSWDDSLLEFPSTAIAIGYAFSYIGPDVVLNSANRDLGCGPLDSTIYPNGSTLTTGTIIDADMIWNDTNFDYTIVPNTTAGVVDIRAVAAHEFGHLFGISHTSLAFTSVNPATMFPAVSTTNTTWQNNVRTLAADDEMAAGRSYPGNGFYPTGTAPWTTGSITGRIRQVDGTAASGVRIWAYDASSPFNSSAPPVYEAFSATALDAETGVSAGDYSFRGIPAGEYYVCIVPWDTNVPDAQADNTEAYNDTVLNGSGNTGFPTECYDDAPSGSASPDFSEIDRLRKVPVTVGENTPNINFVTQSQASDIMMVMDVSGSMSLVSEGITKIQALKNAANVFLSFLELDAGHQVGLVQFRHIVDPFAPPFDLQPLGAANVAAATTAINSMYANQMTNLVAGVNEGVNQLAAAAAPTHRQLMLLLTDGKHNTGGSSIYDIVTPLQDNEVTLYSVGFGDDVNDVELTPIALNSGGLHVNNVDTSPMQLNKHFLSVAASAADSTTLIDPHYDLAVGETATLEVPVLASERNVTFAVLWNEPDPDRFTISLKSPGGCTIQTKLNKKGIQVRKGDTYRLVEVDLPYFCRFRQDHAGTWLIHVTNDKDSDHQKHTAGVDIAVYGDSRTHIFAAASMLDDYPALTAKIVAEGEVIAKAKMHAEIILASESVNDSEKLDYMCSQQEKSQRECKLRPVEPQLEERTKFIRLYDDGSAADQRKGDGNFTGLLPLELPGVYHVRVIAEFDDGTGPGKREIITSYLFDGKRIYTKK